MSECSICLEDIDGGITKTECSHVFHTACLNVWFKYGDDCPVCRYVLVNRPHTNADRSEVVVNEILLGLIVILGLLSNMITHTNNPYIHGSALHILSFISLMLRVWMVAVTKHYNIARGELSSVTACFVGLDTILAYMHVYMNTPNLNAFSMHNIIVAFVNLIVLILYYARLRYWG